LRNELGASDLALETSVGEGLAESNNSITAYDGAETKMRRLGLEPLVEEVKNLVKSTSILLKERRREGSTSFNGAAAIRQLLDDTFHKTGTWDSKQSGDVDWSKCKVVNGTRVCNRRRYRFGSYRCAERSLAIVLTRPNAVFLVRQEGNCRTGRGSVADCINRNGKRRPRAIAKQKGHKHEHWQTQKALTHGWRVNYFPA
jgi:hypothetical protein